MRQKIQTSKSAYCIAVIPLLFETDPNPLLNRILVVDATEKQQIERARIRDNLTPAEIEKVLKTQVTRKHRLKTADDIIENHGDLTDLKKQVTKLHDFYLTLVSTHNKSQKNELGSF
jgi:dephospho-CoA kinase